MKIVVTVIVCLKLSLSAVVQTKSNGSIAVIDWSKDEIVVAADSRESGPYSYSDTGCKIATFGNKLIFAATGRSRPPTENSWNIYTIASDHFSRIARKGTPNRLAERLATAWGNDVKVKFERSGESALLGLDDKFITSGFFADFEKDGSLLIAMSTVTYEKLPSKRTRITVNTEVVPGGEDNPFPRFLGHADIVNEALAAKTRRGIAWRQMLQERVNKSSDPLTEEVIGLVDLTIDNLPATKTDQKGIPFSIVGPPVAAVRLVRSRGIDWIAKGKCTP